MQHWALTSLLALAGLLGAGQALAASSPPFVDNGDGTVTDTSTGLMWDQCADGLSGNGTCATGALVGYDWSNALVLAARQNAANYKVYSDWRLPSVVELKSLIKGTTAPTIDTAAFPNTPSSQFWSGSPNVGYSSSAWVVIFSDGVAIDYARFFSLSVRLVRGGQYFGSFGLFFLGVSGISTSAATLTATSTTGATGHWLVVPRNATPPSAAQIIAGASYPTVTVAAHGSAAMTANTPATLALTGLAAGTSYDLYMVAKESTYETTSNVSGAVQFSTLAIATSSIVIDPATATTLYAGLDGAGVYKSTNSGGAWTAAATQPANLRVKALVIKPGAPATLFAATYGGGVFQSSDSGVNWNVACNAQPTNQNLLSLVIDATGKLYAGSEAGVFVSTDGCVSWTAKNTGMP